MLSPAISLSLQSCRARFEEFADSGRATGVTSATGPDSCNEAKKHRPEFSDPMNPKVSIRGAVCQSTLFHSSQHHYGLMLLLLEKTVPNLVQLGD
jgi:hypothetical protein